jgi:hypothetical protein
MIKFELSFYRLCKLRKKQFPPPSYSNSSHIQIYIYLYILLSTINAVY